MLAQIDPNQRHVLHDGLSRKENTLQRNPQCRVGVTISLAQREGRLIVFMIVFIDETGISERPTRVRTWAPKGQTPVIQFHFNWIHVSAIAGLSRTNYLFRLYEGSVKKEQVVEFLKALKAHLKQPLLIIWDGARPHRAAMIREYLVDSLDGHIHVAFLPPYSPELNPVEYLWAWLKRHAIANFCPNWTTSTSCEPSPATSSRALSAGRRLSPRAGFRQRCRDVMIYGKINELPILESRSRAQRPSSGRAIFIDAPVRPTQIEGASDNYAGSERSLH
ncbi:transposase [Paraburkholderia sp. BL21I4N1]|nr:transposase [Paraburkholderia sp. BL21I4N1]